MAARTVATPVVWAARSFLRALPTSPHRISGRMLLMTFLGLLLLPVDRFCWCWIPWFPSMKSRAYGQTLTFCLQTQWLSCGICSKQSDLPSLCFEGDPTCNHDSSSYKTRLQSTRHNRLAGKSPVGDTTSVILDSSKTLVASCTST